MKKISLLICILLCGLLVTLSACSQEKVTRGDWNKAFEALNTCSISYYGYRDNQVITNNNLKKDSNIIHINSIHYLFNTQDNILYYYTDTNLTNQVVTNDLYNLESLFNVIYYQGDYSQYTYDSSNQYYYYSVNNLVITIKFDANKKHITSIELNHISSSTTESNLNYDRFTITY